jgi:hypothetical protein
LAIGTTFAVNAFIDVCDISQMKDEIVATNSKTTTLKMKNSKCSDVGKKPCVIADERLTLSNVETY